MLPSDKSSKLNSTVATVRGTFWTYLSTLSGRLILFLSTILLSRILSSQDFGIAAYALVTIGLLDILSDLGIGSALIYYRNDPQRVNSGFWLGIGIGVSLFLLTWVLAPVVAVFFQDERAIPVIRALAFTFPLTALSNVHDALLRKKMEFGRKMVPDVLRPLGKGIFSIVFALMGFGAYSLVYGQLAGTALSVIAYWVVYPWRPSFQFRVADTKKLLSYGLGIVSVNATAIFLLNIDYLLVGRYLGVVALGIYMLSFRVPELLIKELCGTVGKVIFPVYAKLKNEPALLSEGFLVTLRYVTMFTIPAALGLALTAEPFVLTVFSEKWAGAIPVIPAICIYTLIRSVTFNAGDIYKAQGRLRLLNVLQLLQAAILVPSLWWSVMEFRSIAAVGWTVTAVAFVMLVVRIAVAGRMLQIPFRSFLSAMQPAVVAGAFMSIAVIAHLRALAAAPPWIQLVSAITIGAIVYAVSLWWLRRDVIITARNTLRMAFARR